ncbi:MAG: SH3 domain-containing protein [Lachnospiraceae bacterium]|nr:SH3 domain-containing protein [Lachnospiraceae bacterium]
MKRKLALTLSCLSVMALFMTGCGEVATVADAEGTAATESGSTEEPSSGLAQADLTATPSPAPTASPIPTATPVPTATPSPEPATRTISPDYSVTDFTVTMYAKSAVNVRSLPDTTGDKVGNLTQNQEVTVTGKCNETGWYEIAYDNGTAYVSDAYLVSEKVTATVASTGSSRQSAGSNGTYVVNENAFNHISDKIMLQWFNDPNWNPSEVCNEECSVKGMTYGEINDLFLAGRLTSGTDSAPANGVSSGTAGTAVAGGSGSYAVEAGFLRDWAEQIFALVNAERAAAGLNELTWDENLYNHAMDRCYANDGHAGMQMMENYAYGTFGSAQSIHDAWKNSQGHHDNYMRESHAKGAVAVYNTENGIVAYEVFEAATEWVNKNTGEVETAPVVVYEGELTWHHECSQGYDAKCMFCNPDGWLEEMQKYNAQ